MSSSVLITGASTGIGKACALRCAREGWRVFAGVRRPADGGALEREAGELAGELTPIRLDVTVADDLAALRTTLDSELGDAGLTGLVNNAGIAVGGPLEFIDLDRLRQQMEVNVIGPVAVTQSCIPALRRARGRVINISSISGRMAFPFIGPYVASKFGLEALSDALRVELAPWGIRVAIIEPGTVTTPIFDKTFDGVRGDLERAPPEAKQYYGAVLEGFIEHAASVEGLDPAVIANAVWHALTARRPKTRYLLGHDARSGLMLSRMPDRFRDWVLGKMLPRWGPDQ